MSCSSRTYGSCCSITVDSSSSFLGAIVPFPHGTWTDQSNGLSAPHQTLRGRIVHCTFSTLPTVSRKEAPRIIPPSEHPSNIHSLLIYFSTSTSDRIVPRPRRDDDEELNCMFSIYVYYDVISRGVSGAFQFT